MASATALVLVSHSAQLARGCAEVAQQMAPDVQIRAAGGTGDGGIGTSFDLVSDAVSELLGSGSGGVVLLTDLGSATMTAETVLDLLGDDRVALALGPFVEGAVAAAVQAQSGGDIAAVRAAVVDAAASMTPDPGDDTYTGNELGDIDELSTPGQEPAATATLRNTLGLHARPAATLARTAARFDATVVVNGVDATSVLALMGLGLPGGAQLELRATGPQARVAIDAITAQVEAGLGED